MYLTSPGTYMLGFVFPKSQTALSRDAQVASSKKDGYPLGHPLSYKYSHSSVRKFLNTLLNADLK